MQREEIQQNFWFLSYFIEINLRKVIFQQFLTLDFHFSGSTETDRVTQISKNLNKNQNLKIETINKLILQNQSCIIFNFYPTW